MIGIRNSLLCLLHSAACTGAIALASTGSWAQDPRCMPEVVAEGRVASIIDGRTLTMQDGREVRLAGVEDTVSGVSAKIAQRAALESILSGRDIVLRGSPRPDRYGRTVAFGFLTGQNEPVQATLIGDGHAAVTAPVDDRGCAALLLDREAGARRDRRGIWSEPAALKNTEMPGDILALVGQFVVVEGRVLSVREAGATLYINFGRRWTQDFAVTISRRNVAAFEAAGVPLKSLERRRLLVRGWVEQRGGPRIHLSWPGQISVWSAN